jgi:2-polyprenyl-3-methyl-5-hydroxy-6-metoxy-1,4-benzoquinol methylase
LSEVLDDTFQRLNDAQVNMDTSDIQPRFACDSIEWGYYDRVFRRSAGVQSKWHHLKFARIRSEMSNYDTHLDIGCGPGTFIGTLKSPALSIGVDIAENQIAYAQSRYKSPSHQFKCIDSIPLPFEAGAFQVVTIIELIEHLSMKDNFALMREAFRILEPNGLILISTPNYASLWPVIERFVNKFGDISYEHQHITHFNRSSLDALMQQAGFCHTRVDAYQFIAPFLALLNWRLADVVHRLEPKHLVSRFGLLLLASGRKR